MSCKIPVNSGSINSGSGGGGSLKLNSVDQQQWAKQAGLDANVKLAGEEAKDRLYEPKHKKKLVRVLTVVAYVFFVSLAAIMLSLYYVFLWDANPKEGGKGPGGWTADKRTGSGNLCTNGDSLPEQPRAIPVLEASASTTTDSPIDEDMMIEPESEGIIEDQETAEAEEWSKFKLNRTEKTIEEDAIEKPLMKKLAFSKLLN